MHGVASNMQGGCQDDVLVIDFLKAFDKVGLHGKSTSRNMVVFRTQCIR